MRDIDGNEPLLPNLRVIAERRIGAALHMTMYAKDVVRANELDMLDGHAIEGNGERPHGLTLSGRWCVVQGVRWVEAADTDGHMMWFALNPDRVGRKAIAEDDLPRTIAVNSFSEIIDHPLYTSTDTAKS